MNFEAERQPRYMRLLFAALLFVGLANSALAADVKASLSRESAVVGESVRLEIRIEGGRPSAPPPDIQVDGLSINYMGTSQSQQFMINGGSMRLISEVIYSYQVTPERAGLFTIPALEVDADGKVTKTQPVTLRAQNDRGGRAGGGAGDEKPMTRVGFAEITLPKNTAYVGEAVPVEIRLFVDSAIQRWQPEMMPVLEGEGFTKTKMPEPRQERARRDGRDYEVLVFRTLVTPSKAGKIQIGPTELSFQAQIPRPKPKKRSRSAFDDFFGDDFFNDPFGAFPAVERRTAKASAVELDVKPLPAAGKPASFSGGVGKFTLTAEGTPKVVKVGDPLTMTLTVSGEGNFDRMGEPVLVNRAGWRTYPPSSNFQPDPDGGMRGHKTFQVAVIPETRKTEMPQFEFSYFDPEKEKYVTLTSAAAPLTVEGGTPPPPAPAAARPTPAQSVEKPSIPDAETPAPMTDILGLRYDEGRKASFTPLYEKPAFWLAQLVPLTALLGILGMRLKRSNAEARAVAKLRRERSAQLARLHKENSRAEFLDAAARAIQLDTALLTGQMPGTVDAAEACRSRQLDSGTMESVQAIFDSRAELLYAGDGHVKESVSPAERQQVLATVEQFEKSHGRN